MNFIMGKKPVSAILLILLFAVTSCDGMTGSDGYDGHYGDLGEKGDIGAQGEPGELDLPCSGCVETQSIIIDAVTDIKIEGLSVGSTVMIDGLITEVKFADSAVITEKFADSSVTTIKLANGSINTANIEDLAVTNEKIAYETIETRSIKDGSVENNNLRVGSVYTKHIEDGSITSSHIVPDEINRVWTVTEDAEATISGVTDFVDLDGMAISVPGNGSWYLVMFDSSFYSTDTGLVDLSVKITVGGVEVNTQYLPVQLNSTYASGVCSNFWGGCSYPAHTHNSAKYAGKISMHWAGQINSNQNVVVQWRNRGSNIIYQRSDFGTRTLTVIEFANAIAF